MQLGETEKKWIETNNTERLSNVQSTALWKPDISGSWIYTWAKRSTVYTHSKMCWVISLPQDKGQQPWVSELVMLWTLTCWILTRCVNYDGKNLICKLSELQGLKVSKKLTSGPFWTFGSHFDPLNCTLMAEIFHFMCPIVPVYMCQTWWRTLVNSLTGQKAKKKKWVIVYFWQPFWPNCICTVWSPFILSYV